MRTDVYSSPIPRTLLIKLNNSHEFLNDVKARQALSMALDRSAIAKNVLHSEGAQTTQLFPASFDQWHVPSLPNDEYDLAKAQSLLEELGWQKNNQGFLTKDGKIFELTMLTYADRPELTFDHRYLD